MFALINVENHFFLNKSLEYIFNQKYKDL